MSNRTTINVDKETHSEAKETKNEHDETWPEVLQFYAEYRSQVDNGELETGDLDELAEQISGSNRITYDDVKAACGAAVRDELPENLRS